MCRKTGFRSEKWTFGRDVGEGSGEEGTLWLRCEAGCGMATGELGAVADDRV